MPRYFRQISASTLSSKNFTPPTKIGAFGLPESGSPMLRESINFRQPLSGPNTKSWAPIRWILAAVG
jgi:hypothetical protein